VTLFVTEYTAVQLCSEHLCFTANKYCLLWKRPKYFVAHPFSENYCRGMDH